LTLLVLDEQLAGKSLMLALEARGLEVKTLGNYGVTGRPDPDVVRRIDEREPTMWVLVTMGLTIVEEHPGFDWDRYAIAWIVVHQELRGAKFEQSKHNIVHRYAHEIVQQGRGDHHSYSEQRRTRSRPSLSSQLKRRL
jgi:hypothetical protein